MPTYQFGCKDCNQEFDKIMSFAEYDKHNDGQIKIFCECGSPNVYLCITGGLMVMDGDPKTLGGLADRNVKYRLPQVEAEQQKKDEERRKQGKFVPNRKARQTKIIDSKEVLKERAEVKNEYIRKQAESKLRERSTRSYSDCRKQSLRTKK